MLWRKRDPEKAKKLFIKILTILTSAQASHASFALVKTQAFWIAVKSITKPIKGNSKKMQSQNSKHELKLHEETKQPKSKEELDPHPLTMQKKTSPIKTTQTSPRTKPKIKNQFIQPNATFKIFKKNLTKKKKKKNAKGGLHNLRSLL